MLQSTSWAKIFLILQKAQATKAKINIWDYIKLKASAQKRNNQQIKTKDKLRNER